MVRYFYAWTPFLIVAGTAVILTIPYLALIVFAIVALVALYALARALVTASMKVGRAAATLGAGAYEYAHAPHPRIDYRAPEPHAAFRKGVVS